MLTFLLILVLLAIGVGAVHLLVPNEFSVARSTEINAPIERVFVQVDNLHNYNEWNPWAKCDPTAAHSFEGPDQGVGAKLNWIGKKIGSGSMLNIESKPYSHVQFQLDFIKPFRATNIAEFRFTQIGTHTHIVWSMSGTNKLIGKIISLFMNCDTMIGTQFEAGLAELKLKLEQ